MPVSLYDTMRPVAIGAGLGIGCVGERGFSLLVAGGVGLAFGISAFLIVGRVANILFARLAGDPSKFDAESYRPTFATEFPIAAIYFAVFTILLLTTIAGCYAGKWVLSEIRF
jgi:hypothetical protein